MASITPTLLRRAAVAALAAAAGLALSGCVDAPPQPAPTDDVSASPSAAPSVLPSDTAVEEQGSLDIACADLVDPDAVYAFDPNFGLVGAFEPAAGSAAAHALERDGVVCRWARETGGISIDLSVARLDDAELTELKNEAYASSQMVPTYGEEAYFDADTGTATVFQGSDWLVITSPAFAEPGEATDIIVSALAVLGATP